MLAEQWGLPRFRRLGRALATEGEWADTPLVLLKPQTYMNRSGAAVRELVASVTVDTARELLVVVDDVALPLGSFRLRARGSAGGHNGLRSIEEALGSQADFVLGPFEQEQLSTLADLLPDLADAAECWLVDGIEEAMNRFNRRGSTE